MCYTREREEVRSNACPLDRNTREARALVPQLWHHHVVSGLATTLLVVHLRGEIADASIAQAFVQSQEAVMQADFAQLAFLRSRYGSENAQVFMKRLILEAIEWMMQVSLILRDHSDDFWVQGRPVTRGPTPPEPLARLFEETFQEKQAGQRTMIGWQTPDHPTIGHPSVGQGRQTEEVRKTEEHQQGDWMR